MRAGSKSDRNSVLIRRKKHQCLLACSISAKERTLRDTARRWLHAPFFLLWPPGCWLGSPLFFLLTISPCVSWSWPLWTLPDMSSPGYTLPHIYSKLSPLQYLGAEAIPWEPLASRRPYPPIWGGLLQEHSASCPGLFLYSQPPLPLRLQPAPETTSQSHRQPDDLKASIKTQSTWHLQNLVIQ